MSGRKRTKTGMVNNENENNSMTQETQKFNVSGTKNFIKFIR